MVWVRSRLQQGILRMNALSLIFVTSQWHNSNFRCTLSDLAGDLCVLNAVTEGKRLVELSIETTYTSAEIDSIVNISCSRRPTTIAAKETFAARF
jgi:hypothetical protein